MRRAGKWLTCVMLLSSLLACSTTEVVQDRGQMVDVSQVLSDPVVPAEIVSTKPLTQAAVQRPKIALVLGGGAARGFAHVGVIRALEASGIVPDMVVGTSAGSVVGALYAYGYSPAQLTRLARDMDEGELSDWSVPFFSGGSGVLKGEGVQAYINKAVKYSPIEKFKIPFGAVATDLQSGKGILFRRGNAGMAVRASSAVPGVFQPVVIGARSYVDGGLVAPVPVRYAREMGADFVIAVNISAQPEGQSANSAVNVVLQTFAIMGQTINDYALREADIVIRPALGEMKGNDFGERRVAILAGENALLRALPAIRGKLASWQPR